MRISLYEIVRPREIPSGMGADAENPIGLVRALDHSQDKAGILHHPAANVVEGGIGPVHQREAKVKAAD